ncbi:MAG: GNAT family N-acetyltransferase [Deltaproteobacteria bacterium]|nr:GNAT family N-acetyltransferase [Deltaproteobacteria bacterium]
MSSVHRASEAEIGPLVALAHALGFSAYDRAALKATRDRPGGLLLSTGPESLLVAEVLAPEAELHLIGVAPAFRGRGLATSLLLACQFEARAQGAERLLLEVASRNTPALVLYQRQGFTVVGRRRGYYRDGDDALLMSLSLG